MGRNGSGPWGRFDSCRVVGGEKRRRCGKWRNGKADGEMLSLGSLNACGFEGDGVSRSTVFGRMMCLE